MPYNKNIVIYFMMKKKKLPNNNNMKHIIKTFSLFK